MDTLFTYILLTFSRRHKKTLCFAARLLPGALLLLVAGSACADGEDALMHLTTLNLEDLLKVPVVLSVSRLSQPLDEAPAAVTVIDRQMIKDSGAWDLSEVMRLAPGMYVAYHAARFYSTDSTVSYHGLMSETMSHRMQVLVDGRSVYSPLYGGVIWSDIPVAMDDIERIEVIRGPDSASYGANSFLGVINIITRHSAQSQGKFVSLSAGRGRSEGLTRYGGQNGDLTYRMTVGLRDDQGQAADIRNPTSQSYIWTKNKFDDKNIRLLTFRADYQVNPADELEFQFGYNGGPRQAGEVDSGFAPNKRADNHFEQLHWRRALENGGELSAQFYHIQESSTAPLMQADGVTLAGNGDVIARRYDLEVQHSFAPGANTRLVWGGSVRYDKTFAPNDLAISGPELYEDRSYRLSRLFGNLEWRVHPEVVLNLGAMVEKNDFTGTDITPRMAANWHFQPGHTLRISQSQATRTPSVYEKRVEEYAQTNGFPNLPTQLPERVESSDIGYLGKLGGVDVDFRLFRDVYSDLIADRTDALKHNNLNSGSATVKGFETQLKWNISERTRLIYALSHAIVASPNVDRIPYTNSAPTNNQSLLLSHRFDSHWSASLAGYQVSETHFSRTDYDPAQGRGYFIESFRRWDSRLAYSFNTGGTKGELALMVQNLSDKDYFEFRHDNQAPGRTAWVNLKLEL